MINLPETKLCHLDYEDEWLNIYLNNNKKKNALSSKLIEEMIIVLDAAKENKLVRGIFIKGGNGIFCSGADLDELRQITYNKGESENMTIEMSKKIGHLLFKIDTMPKLTVSVIEGHCIAGGIGIACATDIVLSSHESIFRLSETRIGLTPSQIAPYVLKKIDFSKARLLMLLGNSIDGNVAHDIGLVDYLATTEEDINKYISQVKSKLEKCSPNAFALTKNLISANTSIDIQKAAEIFNDCVKHHEGKEGLESFFEKFGC